eukprot:9150709-Alexandrium_andersonii.AAC.1
MGWCIGISGFLGVGVSGVAQVPRDLHRVLPPAEEPDQCARQALQAQELAGDADAVLCLVVCSVPSVRARHCLRFANGVSRSRMPQEEPGMNGVSDSRSQRFSESAIQRVSDSRSQRFK